MSDVKISQILWWTSSDNSSLILHTEFYASTIENKWSSGRGGGAESPPGPASF